MGPAGIATLLCQTYSPTNSYYWLENRKWETLA
jgi:hypothetical protein